jgi:hypothetical protein
MINEEMKLLGFKVREKVTGFVGVVSSISFDLYGCTCAFITQEIHLKDGEQRLGDGSWFDTKRLVKLSKKPVMSPPNYEVIEPIGGETKSAPHR